MELTKQLYRNFPFVCEDNFGMPIFVIPTKADQKDVTRHQLEWDSTVDDMKKSQVIGIQSINDAMNRDRESGLFTCFEALDVVYLKSNKQKRRERVCKTYALETLINESKEMQQVGTNFMGQKLFRATKKIKLFGKTVSVQQPDPVLL